MDVTAADEGTAVAAIDHPPRTWGASGVTSVWRVRGKLRGTGGHVFSRSSFRCCGHWYAHGARPACRRSGRRVPAVCGRSASRTQRTPRGADCPDHPVSDASGPRWT
ncbi:hypothetical protein [Streptomyces sp. WAC05374]|uniref:hypothetical protein n=1 Tax=Streptomyces sp. WAC05374 TaxID=2487420 RepID=UPI0037DDA908